MGEHHIGIKIDINVVVLILCKATWLVVSFQHIILNFHQQVEVCGIPYCFEFGCKGIIHITTIRGIIDPPEIHRAPKSINGSINGRSRCGFHDSRALCRCRYCTSITQHKQSPFGGISPGHVYSGRHVPCRASITYGITIGITDHDLETQSCIMFSRKAGIQVCIRNLNLQHPARAVRLFHLASDDTRTGPIQGLVGVLSADIQHCIIPE